MSSQTYFQCNICWIQPAALRFWPVSSEPQNVMTICFNCEITATHGKENWKKELISYTQSNIENNLDTSPQQNGQASPKLLSQMESTFGAQRTNRSSESRVEDFKFALSNSQNTQQDLIMNPQNLTSSSEDQQLLILEKQQKYQLFKKQLTSDFQQQYSPIVQQENEERQKEELIEQISDLEKKKLFQKHSQNPSYDVFNQLQEKYQSGGFSAEKKQSHQRSISEVSEGGGSNSKFGSLFEFKPHLSHVENNLNFDYQSSDLLHGSMNFPANSYDQPFINELNAKNNKNSSIFTNTNLVNNPGFNLNGLHYQSLSGSYLNTNNGTLISNFGNSGNTSLNQQFISQKDTSLNQSSQEQSKSVFQNSILNQNLKLSTSNNNSLNHGNNSMNLNLLGNSQIHNEEYNNNYSRMSLKNNEKDQNNYPITITSSSNKKKKTGNGTSSSSTKQKNNHLQKQTFGASIDPYSELSASTQPSSMSINQGSEFEKLILKFGSFGDRPEDQEFMRSLVQLHRQEIQNMETQFKIRHLEQENTISELKSHLENLEQRYDQNFNQMKRDASQSHNKLYQEKSKFENSLNETRRIYEQRIHELQHEIEQRRDRENVLEKKIEEMQRTYKRAMKEKQDSIQEAEQEIQQLNNISNMQKRDIEEQIGELREEMVRDNEDAVMRMKREYEISLLEQQNVIESQNNLLMHMEREMQIVKGNVNSVQSKFNNIIQSKDEEIRFERGQSDVLRGEINKLNRLLNDVRTEIQILQQQMQLTDKEKIRLKNDYDQLYSKLNQYEKILYGNKREGSLTNQSRIFQQ